MKKLRLLVLLLLLGGGAAYGYMVWHAPKENRPLTLFGNVDIRTVQASFRVGGRLLDLYADEGDQVEAGMLLGSMDPLPFENALREAEAAVAAQKARLELLEAGYRDEEIAQARAEVEERRAALTYAERFYQRQAGLLPARAVSANQVDTARTNRDQARAALQASLDKLDQYETGNRREEIAEARALLMQAEASLDQARLNLEDTKLLSPSHGTILTRAAEPGTMLASGTAVFTISLTRPVWVRAYVDGNNLHRAVPGTVVYLGTDARPAGNAQKDGEASYRGTIGFVSPTAEFTPKTVQTPELRTDLVYRLRIIVENPDDALRQGMPVTVLFPR